LEEKRCLNMHGTLKRLIAKTFLWWWWWWWSNPIRFL